MPSRRVWPWLVLLCALLFTACATGGDDDEGDDDGGPDDDVDDDAGPDDDAADDDTEKEFDQALFDSVVEKMGFAPYADIEPVRVVENAGGGYTRYYFSTDDMRCYDGTEANVAIWPGDPKRIMFFMEGGGASWPGYNLAFQVDYLIQIGYRNRKPQNPMRDWTIVYVPYCDNSLHVGDNEIEEGGRTVYYHGLRHATASAAQVKRLYPDAEQILVTGASAGGMGTYVGWPIVKYFYPDARTAVMSDSGVGFWNPNEPDTWETMKEAWNVRIPDNCTRCDGSTIQTWLYSLMLDIDPELRIGMFSSWGDKIITGWFLFMDPHEFAGVLRDVTDQIKSEHPDRFARFFISGRSHTCYEFLLPEGADYAVDGQSLYDWIGAEVNMDPLWDDRIEDEGF